MRITFYVGIGFDKDGKVISPRKSAILIRAALECTCKHYGGCTLTRGQGAWLDVKGRLVAEECIILTVEYGSSSPHSVTRAEHAAWLRDLCNQTSVVVSTSESSVEFI